MTWIKFALSLCGVYVVYYAVIIFWDSFRSKILPSPAEMQELSFAEHVEPIRPGPEFLKEYPASAVVSSGGVSLKKLFNLSREDAIEFTRAVSF